MKQKLTLVSCLLAGMLTLSCEDERDQVAAALKVNTLAAGLNGPIGVDTDTRGRVWVSESGSGKNDGRVSMITADGKVYPVITDFPSTALASGEISGTDHLLFADGVLYILDKSKLYTANVTGFNPGDASVPASSLTVQDIGQFVLSYPFVHNAHDSHLYNVTPGPDGALYFTDAGANAIIRRAKTGELSVLAEIPGIPNATPVGPPVTESVPTGIAYDGQNFLVSTLLGFPFPAGKAMIYQVTTAGKVSVYQSGFNSLTGVKVGESAGPLVLEYAQFGPQGFVAKTGRLLHAKGTSSTVVLDGLNQPTDLKLAAPHTYYLTTLGDNSVQRIVY